MQKYRLSQTSLNRLNGVHPDLVRVVKRAIEITDIDFTVLEGLRTTARQKQLVAQGASQTMKSKHIEGNAVDLGAYVKGGVNWDEANYYPIMAAMAQAAHELKIPVRSGGCWRSLLTIEPTVEAMRAAVAAYVAERRKAKKKPFLDFVHFEL